MPYIIWPPASLSSSPTSFLLPHSTSGAQAFFASGPCSNYSLYPGCSFLQRHTESVSFRSLLKCYLFNDDFSDHTKNSKPPSQGSLAPLTCFIFPYRIHYHIAQYMFTCLFTVHIFQQEYGLKEGRDFVFNQFHSLLYISSN